MSIKSLKLGHNINSFLKDKQNRYPELSKPLNDLYKDIVNS